MDEEFKEFIKKNLNSNKIILGSNKVLKLIRAGKIKKVYIASNCREDIKRELEQLSKVGNFELIELKKLSNKDVGILCRRQHNVSVVGIQE